MDKDKITAELKVLADAAIGHVRALLEHEGAYAGYSHASIEAQKFLNGITTQAKECRPPDGAKDGSRWYLTRGDEWTVAWLRFKPDMWFACGYDGMGFERAAEEGWTVHSECRFGETGVEATAAMIESAAAAMNPKLFSGDRTVAHREASPSDVEFARDRMRRNAKLAIEVALTHFRAPKLEISDEEIIEIVRPIIRVDVRSPDRVVEAIRAIIAKVESK